MKIKEIVIVAIIVFIDLLSKFIISSNINLHSSITVIENLFYITYVKNTGAAWSILEGEQFILSSISFVAVVYMIYWLFKNKSESPISRYLICVILAGAFGNFVDRVYLGYVRDFLHVYIFNYSFPVFNIADMALSIGIFLLFMVGLKEAKDGKN